MKHAIPLLFSTLFLLTGCGSDNDDNDSGGGGGGGTSNTAPEAVDDEVSAQSATELSIDVLENDSDADGDTLEITDVSDPENGSATIDGGVILYTSNDGYTGSDTFTYTISDGEDEASAEVFVTVEQTVSVSGKVVDSPIAGAAVSVTVGGETYTTTADADGNYVLDVTFTDGTELLTLTAQGSEENNQGYVELMSAMSSMASLAEAAGEDGILDRSEAAGTNVTNVTTASYTLMLDASGGEPPADDEALSVAQEAVDPNELLEVSAVIKLIIDNDSFSLPEGAESTLDLIANVESYNAYVEEVETTDPEALNNVVEEIINDPELVEQQEDPTLPEFYLPTSATRPGFVSRSYEVLVFEDDGTGMVISPGYNSEGSNSAFSWELAEDGFYTLTYENPVEFTSFPSVQGVTDDPGILAAYEAAGVNQVQATYSETGKRFKVITKGNRQDSIREEYSQTVTYAPLEWEGETYQISPDQNEYTSNLVYLNGDNLDLIPMEQEQLVGTWAVNVLGQFGTDESFNRFASDMVTFNEDGTFSALYTGVEGTWELTEDGSVDMLYGDVDQSVEFFNQVGELYAALVGAETPDGNLVASYNRVVKQNPELEVTEADFLTNADEFWLGHINSWVQASWNEELDIPNVDQYWGWQFDSGTIGHNVYLYCEAPNEEGFCEHGETSQLLWVNPVDWFLDSPEQELEIVRLGDCTVDVCLTRHWDILQEADDGWIYVLEFDFYDYVPGNGEADMSEIGGAYHRVNMMEKRQLPDGLANSDMGATATAASVELSDRIERLSFLPRNERATGSSMK